MKTIEQIADDIYEQRWQVTFSPATIRKFITKFLEAHLAEHSEPVAWRWSESDGARWFGWTTQWENYEFAKQHYHVELAYVAPQPAVPAGWKIVPIEPTSEMIILGGEVYFDTTRLEKQGSTTFDQNSAISIYTAMLAAAPEVGK
jgi:hypothetical protein